MKEDIILGIGGLTHGTAAALMREGEILAAAEEERFNRIKHYAGFPAEAIAFCLRQAGIAVSDVTDIAVGSGVRTNAVVAADASAAASSREGEIISAIERLAGTAHRLVRVHFVPHHLAHAASAFFMQDLDEAAFLSVDYLAENDTILAGRISRNACTPLFSVSFPHSLGILSAAITEHLGFMSSSDEYKVMGLGSYGSPLYMDEMRRLVSLKADGTLELNSAYFDFDAAGRGRPHATEQLTRLLGPRRAPDEEIGKRHADIAASAQAVIQEAVLHLVAHLRRKLALDHLCYTGELALNCTANSALADAGLFERIFVHPASNDAGTAIGACFYVDRIVLENERAGCGTTGVYLGPGYTAAEIAQAVEGSGLSACDLDDAELPRACAEDLARGMIVGWFQGRMEWGPRALGNRSILADPRRKGMVERINAAIKFRESFRPFAPSVLLERAPDYFEYAQSGDMSYMLFLARARDIARERAPAVVHVDGTSRIQTVARETNPLYWRLISAFEDTTGIPLVLNTSFNVMGEPIVRTPSEAIRCFATTGIDVLYLGTTKIIKQGEGRRP